MQSDKVTNEIYVEFKNSNMKDWDRYPNKFPDSRRAIEFATKEKETSKGKSRIRVMRTKTTIETIEVVEID